MKIAVVGAGAMGSIFGSRLTEAGHKTVLVDVSEPLVERLNADGVTIVRGDHERTTAVTATADPSALGAMDAVVFFVKCYHTRSAAELARPLVASNTVVASLQNGWGNGDVLAGVYPAAQIVVGVTYNSGLVHGPGRVVHPAEQPTIVGSFVPDGALDGAARLAHALADAGFEASVASPVQPEIWKKLILNAASLPTSALTGMNAGALTDCEETHALASDVAVESVAGARLWASTSTRTSGCARYMRSPRRPARRRPRCSRISKRADGRRSTSSTVRSSRLRTVLASVCR